MGKSGGRRGWGEVEVGEESEGGSGGKWEKMGEGVGKVGVGGGKWGREWGWGCLYFLDMDLSLALVMQSINKRM